MGIFDSSPLPSSPTSQRLETSSISPWAQPYVSSYLDRAQGLINQGPTGFQNQVYSSAQNMGMPQQFAMGTNLANQGGQGALSTAPMALNYGQMGTDIGQKGIGIGAMGQQYGMGAGQNYVNQATNPSAVGAFMNPYIQQSLAPQLALLNQQQQLGAQGIAAKAVGQGAFGGNRATLAQGLNAQNYDLARQQAIGQGYNEAFRQAQQAQQFGSQLGLQGAMQGTQAGLAGIDTALKGTGLGLQGVSGAQQGYQGATQAGSALGNIGAQQGQYELAKLALQNQIANQQYNQPFQNLEFQRSMLSGLPVSSSSTQGFQAPPNALSQIAGLGSTIIGGVGLANKAGLFDFLKNKTDSESTSGPTFLGGGEYSDDGPILLNGAKGGQITKNGVKRYAKGGKVNYATGGDIDLMPTDQLAPMMQNPNIDPVEAALIQQELMIRARMASNPQTPQIMGGGLDTIPSGDMFRAAGGGIVAFAGQGSSVVKEKPGEARQSYREQLEKEVLEGFGRLKTTDPYKQSADEEEKIRAEMAESKKMAPYEALLMAGLGTLSGTSPYGLTNIGLGGIEGMKTYGRSKTKESDLQKLLLQQSVEQEKAKYARDTGLLTAQQTALGQIYGKEADIERSKIAKAQLGQGRETQNMLNAQRIFDNALKAEKTNLFQQNKAKFNMDYSSAELDAEATANVMKRLTPGIKNILFPAGSLAPDVAAPAPVVPPAGKGADAKTFNVVVDGKTFSFPTKEAADTFKDRAKKLSPNATIK